MNQTPLDGNVAAGDLSDLFAFDVTVATTTCATCHHQHPVAALGVYTAAPGLVVRCASCGAVQMRVVRSSARVWIDLRGVDLLEIPEPVSV
jgi:Family of unknown function (DUF6510)